jgi:hypothetical protein
MKIYYEKLWEAFQILKVHETIISKMGGKKSKQQKILEETNM